MVFIERGYFIPTVQPTDIVVMLPMCSVAHMLIQLLYVKGNPLYLWAPHGPHNLYVVNRSRLLVATEGQ